MTALAPIEAWFDRQGWRPMAFQRDCWQAYLAGESGLLQVPTGSGKTYAAVMGPIAELLAERLAKRQDPDMAKRGVPGSGQTSQNQEQSGTNQAPHSGRRSSSGRTAAQTASGLHLLVITPLRALSRDLALAIEKPIQAMGWPLRVGIRNGDTSTHERSKQLRTPPEILITTPESLALLLSHEVADSLFAGLQGVVLDEWHELIGSKRGSQCELCLSWLRHRRPQLRTWALSATIGNLEEAARAAVGAAVEPRVIQAPIRRTTRIESLLPERIDGFPWAGHLGLRMHQELLAALDPAVSTLLFTNTRNQAERWHQCLRYVAPEMEEALALHHSALDRSERERIEAGVKDGSIRWVVCTSSLDLGVDFQPVETVVQIGSPRNLARLLQRAGRSAHTPGGVGRVLFLPTNALELLEVSAMRRGLERGAVEERRPPRNPLDVLLQHLTGLACGSGFDPVEELSVVRSAWSFRDLSDSSWQWCLQFLESGGTCLAAYPRFRKLERVPATSGAGFQYRIREPTLARLHRLNIGTITADRSVTVRYVRGGVLGHVEEAFIARLKPGEVFFFAGRQLEFVRLREMTAQVKASQRRSTTVPAWAGGQMALSDLVAKALRQEVTRCAEGCRDNRELQALAPLLERQMQLSRLPSDGEFLVELCRTREGNHLYAYPFEGRFVHEGLGFLWAWRLARQRPGTFTVSVNDHGFELLAARTYPLAELFRSHAQALLSSEGLQDDLSQAVNLSELSRRRFRSIARVSALVVDGTPGRRNGAGQLQLSASLLHDVFERHEPTNLLLAQARREVLEDQLEIGRLECALNRLRESTLRVSAPPRPGPFAFPLLAERLNSRLSNESLLERLQRIMDEATRLEG